jgi:hypothetical protein
MLDVRSRPVARTVASLLALVITSGCAPPRQARRAVAVTVDAADAQEAGRGADPDADRPIAEDASAIGTVPIVVPADAAPVVDAGGSEILEVTFGDPGTAAIDLSATGTLDWVHFGFQGTTRTNRKRGVAPLVQMAPLATSFVGRSSPDFSDFVWSDGDPVATARVVRSGFETSAAAAGGFQVTVQGDPQHTRTVELFVGAAQAGAKLVARLAGAGAAYTDASLTAATPQRNRVYTVRFRPSVAQQLLIVQWTMDTGLAAGGGNVRIQAVTVAESAP